MALNIDFSKVFPETTALKSDSTPEKVVEKGSTRYNLGDSQRLQTLPDQVSTDFIHAYNLLLDELLYPYVVARIYTFEQAVRFNDALIKNLFGTHEYLGIYQYLSTVDKTGLTEKELVVEAERLILKGWHIRVEEEQYWLFDADGEKLADMTGDSGFGEESLVITNSPESAALFFDDSVATKVAAVAKKLGYDVKALVKTSTLDMLLSETDNMEFAGYIINYNAFKKIMSASGKYATSKVGESFSSLYNQGYRYSSNIHLPFEQRCVLDGSGEDSVSLLIKRTSDEFDKQYSVNRSLLSVLAYTNARGLLKPQRIRQDKLLEIKDIKHTIALGTVYYESADVSFGIHELVALLEGAVSRKGEKFNKLLQKLCVLVTTDVLLFGNNNFNVTSFIYEPSSTTIHFPFHESSFTAQFADLENFRLKAPSSASKEADTDIVTTLISGMNSPLGLEKTHKYPLLIQCIRRLPESYISTLRSMEFSTKGYDLVLGRVTDYVNTAKETILEVYEL